MKQVFLLLLIASFVYEKEARRRIKLDGRIIGGTRATIEEFPYQASLQILNTTEETPYFEHICGAAIIDRHWLVSAAHCIQSRYSSMLVIRAGTTNIYEGGSLHKVVDIIIHPAYDVEIDYDCDICLLKVEEELVYSAKIQPIRLPEAGTNVSRGTLVTVAGWGTSELEELDVARDDLRQVTVPIMTNSECSADYGEDFVTDNMICAGNKEGGMDACLGDSGGPLTAGRVQIGIVSWGQGCAQVGYPGMYTKVSKFTEWIVNNTGIWDTVSLGNSDEAWPTAR